MSDQDSSPNSQQPTDSSVPAPSPVAASPEATSAPEPPAQPPETQAPPPPSPASGDFFGNVTGMQWAMMIHFTQFAGYLIPGLGFAAPIVIWQVYKGKFPELDAHGKMVTNWLISLLIYSTVAGVVTFATCGVGGILLVPLLIVSIIFPVLGGIKAGEGTVWNYPLTISFIK